jgi:hypothetical protein
MKDKHHLMSWTHGEERGRLTYVIAAGVDYTKPIDLSLLKLVYEEVGVS